METCFAFFFLIVLEKLPVGWKKEGKEGQTDRQVDRWNWEGKEARRKKGRKSDITLKEFNCTIEGPGGKRA